MHWSSSTNELLLSETRWLHRLTRGLVADAATADDLAQETMLRALQTGDVSRPRAWLRAVAHNLLRRQSRREGMRRAIESRARTAGTEPSTAEVVEKAMVHRSVADAVVALDEPYRSTVLLRYLEDLSPPDVARRLGVPLETVRSRLKRGLQQLRSRLDERHGDRRAWAAPLLGATVSKRVLLGALLMSAKSKLNFKIVAAVVACASVAVWQLASFESAPAPVAGPPGRPAPAVTASVDLREVPADPQTREPVRSDVAAGPAVTLVVTGRVVDEETRQPIHDASIVWFPGPLMRGAVTGEATVSDAAGEFTLTTTRVEEPEHQSLLIRSRDHALFTQQIGTPEPGTPAFRDLGEIAIPPGTGVHGRVVDSAGQAIPRAELWLCRDPVFFPDGSRSVRFTKAIDVGVTDVLGEFHLGDRLAGRGPSYGPWLFAVTTSGLGWTELKVMRKRGESRDNTIRLWPVASLNVRVVDDLGEPIRDATVTVEPRYAPVGHRAGFPIDLGPLFAVFERATGPEGFARFDVPVVSADVSKQPQYGVRVAAAGRSMLDHGDVALEAGEEHDLEIVLAKRRTIIVHGTVTDHDGTPLEGVEVTAHGIQKSQARTDAAGRYRIEEFEAAPDLLIVSVVAEGYTPGQSKRDLDARLAEAQLDFVVEPAAPLFGIVVDQHGAPIPEAQVMLGDGSGSARTEDDGSFRIAAVASNRRQQLRAYPPNGSQAFQGQVWHAAAPADSPLRLQLHRLGAPHARLRVELIDANGEPLEAEGVSLRHLERFDGLHHPATPKIGTVTAADLRDGEWSLSVRAATGHSLERRFRVEPGQDLVELRLVQGPAATIGGEIVFADELERPEQLELWFGRGGQQARFEGSTSRRGRSLKLDPRQTTEFRIIDVDPERPLIVELKGEGVIARATARVSGETGSVRLDVRSASILRLRSTEPWPFEGFILRLRHDGGDWSEPYEFAGMRDDVELVDWPLLPGAFEWRIDLPSLGASNASGVRTLSGATRLAPGEAETITIDPMVR